MRFGDWIGDRPLTDNLQARLQAAGRNRVVVSHAVGAADDGRHAAIKVILLGGASEAYVLPAGLAYRLLDRITRAVDAGAITDRRSSAGPGSPETQQIALYEPLTLAAIDLIKRARPAPSRSEH